MKFWLVVLLVGASAFAAEPSLQALRSTLLPLRDRKLSEATGPRGASDRLTVAKHQLRDWIESRLASAGERAKARDLEDRWRADITAADLACGDEGSTRACPDWDQAGFVRDVSVTRSGAFLVVTTGIGIECGYDDSAYVYSWSGEKWTRIWQNEQNQYTEKAYTPQTLQAVLISPYNQTNDYLVLTVGSESWCSSNWHRVYWRVFRLGADLRAPPLVDGAEWAYLGKHDPPIMGSISSDDVLVEFTVGSIDGGVHSREAIRHYRIESSGAKRIDPLVLSPRDFVDEWLTSDWREAAFWSESANRPSMLEVHRQYGENRVYGEFIPPTKHCATMPDVWQVGLTINEQDSKPTTAKQPEQQRYFLVRWRPPYRFRMVNVTNTPSPDCLRPDRLADDDSRTLFPVQDWR